MLAHKLYFYIIVLLLFGHIASIAQTTPIAQPATISRPPAIAPPDPSTWLIHAASIDPANYYGVTVANGMIGLVSSTDPFKAKDVVLNGAFDLYGRGRVSHILKTFNFIDLFLDIDDQRIDNFKQVINLRQTLDMRHAC